MAKVRFDLGAEIDTLNKDEMDLSLAKAFADAEVAKLRGVKWMRLPEILRGVPASSAISIGETTGIILGPRSGYSWSLMRLVVDGLTASSSTPDTVNLYRGTPAGRPLWQFNGNNFGYTFGKGCLVINGGETLSLANVGTIAATGQITLSGELWEVPTELLGKLS